jgi:hypothetical protein
MAKIERAQLNPTAVLALFAIADCNLTVAQCGGQWSPRPPCQSARDLTCWRLAAGRRPSQAGGLRRAQLWLMLSRNAKNGARLRPPGLNGQAPATPFERAVAGSSCVSIDGASAWARTQVRP